MKDIVFETVSHLVRSMLCNNVVAEIKKEDRHAIMIRRGLRTIQFKYKGEDGWKIFSYNRVEECWRYNGLWFINFATLKEYWNNEDNAWITSVCIDGVPVVILSTDSKINDSYKILKDVK